VYLSYAQIWRLWTNLHEAPCSNAIKIAIKILLATGQRRGELMRGLWQHIDLDKQLWIIPPELSKNGKQHIIQLTPLTHTLFKDLKRGAGDSPYLMPSPTHDSPMIAQALSKALYRFRESIQMPELSPHVLRHTFSTQVNALGVAPHVVEKLLNHNLTGMLAVYNHNHYFSERVEALRKWSEMLLRIAEAPHEANLPPEPNSIIELAATSTLTGRSVSKHESQSSEDVEAVPRDGALRAAA